MAEGGIGKTLSCLSYSWISRLSAKFQLLTGMNCPCPCWGSDCPRTCTVGLRSSLGLWPRRWILLVRMGWPVLLCTWVPSNSYQSACLSFPRWDHGPVLPSLAYEVERKESWACWVRALLSYIHRQSPCEVSLSQQLYRKCLYFCGFKHSAQPFNITNPSESPEQCLRSMPVWASEPQWEWMVGRRFLFKQTRTLGKQFLALLLESHNNINILTY